MINHLMQLREFLSKVTIDLKYENMVFKGLSHLFYCIYEENWFGFEVSKGVYFDFANFNKEDKNQTDWKSKFYSLK